MVVPKESEVKYSLLDEQFFYILIFFVKINKVVRILSTWSSKEPIHNGRIAFIFKCKTGLITIKFEKFNRVHFF